jgi:hypothetical protein
LLAREKIEMGAFVPLPTDFVESLSQLHFPPQTDSRLQELMDRNNQGKLAGEEQQELESLVELSETMSLIRARALASLGRGP